MKKTDLRRTFVKLLLCGCVAGVSVPCGVLAGEPALRKVKDVVVYRDSMYFSAFPSVVARPDGEVWVAFRRAPDRRAFKEDKNTHVDPNSQMVMVRSRDGERWTREPELIYAHAWGGSQDPCLLQCKDGTLICAGYLWAFLRPDGMARLRKPYAEAGGAVFFGGYLVRSTDGGKTWQGPIVPPSVPTEKNLDPFGRTVAAYNRGALCETRDGRILWAVASSDAGSLTNTSVHLMVSRDKGLTWQYGGLIARDERISFNETSIYETPAGDIVAFMRSEQNGDLGCIARSTDGGRTFGRWESMGFQGHPFQALRLPDGRVLLTYGYRHAPFGIRARVLNAECTDYATAEEFVLRTDGGDGDLGYTWAAPLGRGRYLIAYYFNYDRERGDRHIAGTIVEIPKQK